MSNLYIFVEVMSTLIDCLFQNVRNQETLSEESTCRLYEVGRLKDAEDIEDEDEDAVQEDARDDDDDEEDDDDDDLEDTDFQIAEDDEEVDNDDGKRGVINIWFYFRFARM